MKFFATLLIAATAVLAQQQEGNQGPNAATGPNAVSNPNVNSGFQAQGSFFDGSKSGGNVIDGQVGESFNHGASNSGIQDSNFVNPSKNSVSGNHGDTANGADNQIGDFVQDLGFGGAFRRRDTFFNNHEGGFARPGFGAAIPVGAPLVAEPFVGARPVGRVNDNRQGAAIVQNQA
ncbi:hypothetical protein IW140_002176 [Coemansia sp. RSA 1813]|nr:hypothetical protein EV178_001326 [Coemansia sp. RSA 1646]KAJ1770226.1 hypothetical protein LPJ74_003371 [Coemansia sp. RSA 1843]KAJ2090183.1 hypothetical protein IW138_002815 [Coemansia sp. RSA 986]KAJ2214590.1 hypothetical protein EV179_002849 [Coemansia sp. RSA 487]KAJ2570750.1 hypothetical protein IW140_002176 [Coemansia sp. RSA 1813]